MKMPFANNAKNLRILLIIAMTLLVIAVVAGVVYAVKQLNQYATSVSEVVHEAEISQSKLDTLIAQATEIRNESDRVEQVNRIVAESQSYQYQNVIIRDLRAMAANAGVSINSFNFGSADAAGATPGLNSTFVSIDVDNPIPYQDFLNFLRNIELNNTKMQVSSIDIAPAGSESGKQMISSSVLTVEVYTR